MREDTPSRVTRYDRELIGGSGALLKEATTLGRLGMVVFIGLATLAATPTPTPRPPKWVGYWKPLDTHDKGMLVMTETGATYSSPTQKGGLLTYAWEQASENVVEGYQMRGDKKWPCPTTFAIRGGRLIARSFGVLVGTNSCDPKAPVETPYKRMKLGR
jgi:hypothetical protein